MGVNFHGYESGPPNPLRASRQKRPMPIQRNGREGLFIGGAGVKRKIRLKPKPANEQACKQGITSLEMKVFQLSAKMEQALSRLDQLETAPTGKTIDDYPDWKFTASYATAFDAVTVEAYNEKRHMRLKHTKILVHGERVGNAADYARDKVMQRIDAMEAGK